MFAEVEMLFSGLSEGQYAYCNPILYYTINTLIFGISEIIDFKPIVF